MTIEGARLGRREILKTTGVAALGAGFAGCIGENAGNGSGEFPQNDIRFVIPFSSGGGFDAYSRALAEFMPEYLPNDVDVRAENVPGAGGRTGANEVYRADDAHTIGIFNVPGMVTSQLIQETEYDLTEISWIGRPAETSYMTLVNPDSGYESLSDMQEADEVTFTVTDFSSTSSVAAVVGMNELEVNPEFISGYDGSSEAITAVIRGDAEARTANWANAKQLVEDDELEPIISLTEEPPEWAPDVPTAVDEGYEGAQISLQRPVGAPPDADEDAVSILADAFEETVKSDEMKEWSEEAERPLSYLSAEETADLIQNNVETFEEYSDLLQEYQ